MEPNPSVSLPATSAVLVSGPPRWRLNVVHILQLVGILLAVLGSGELLGLFSVFDPELSKKLALAGPTIVAAARPAIALIGDYLDDGERNDSFHLEPAPKAKDDPNQMRLLSLFLVATCALSVVGCGMTGLRIVTPYGSVSSAKDGLVTIKPNLPVRIRIQTHSNK